MPEQLSFAAIFAEAAFEQKTDHLPKAMEDGIILYRRLIDRYHEAILAGRFAAAEVLIEEAHDLAVKLNDGDPGIFADENAPGNLLERETAALPGVVPIWGQTGEFMVEPRPGMKVLVVMEGIFGFPKEPVPSFSAHAVDPAKPFISETGYRSFIGWRFPLVPGMKPDDYATTAIDEHIKRHLKGRLYAIEHKYRESIRESAKQHPWTQPDL